SDHMTEYIASSAFVGRRPRISRIWAYSSGLRPSSAYGCSASGVAAASSIVSYPGGEVVDMSSLAVAVTLASYPRALGTRGPVRASDARRREGPEERSGPSRRRRVRAFLRRRRRRPLVAS